jgi:hypothetical protein
LTEAPITARAIASRAADVETREWLVIKNIYRIGNPLKNLFHSFHLPPTRKNTNQFSPIDNTIHITSNTDNGNSGEL